MNVRVHMSLVHECTCAYQLGTIKWCWLGQRQHVCVWCVFQCDVIEQARAKGEAEAGEGLIEC